LDIRLASELLVAFLKSCLRQGTVIDPTDAGTVYLVSHYYMEERLASLLLLGSILRAHDDPTHVYHLQCQNIASDILADDASV
jgi:hypothetical protein